MSTPLIALTRPPFDAVLYLGMLGLAAIMSIAWVVVLRRIRPAYGYAMAALIALFGAASWGADQLALLTRLDLQPPALVLLTACALTLCTAAGLSLPTAFGSRTAPGPSIQTLVTLQIFRLPLELLMWRAAALSVMPTEFSIRGYNLDMLTGIGALVLSIAIATRGPTPAALVWAWNIFGIACLLTIAVLAALTSPNIHAFGDSAAHINSWVLFFPYTLLPVLLVSFAVLGHVMLTRTLLTRRQ
jgi:hypothetical protein